MKILKLYKSYMLSAFIGAMIVFFIGTIIGTVKGNFKAQIVISLIIVIFLSALVFLTNLILTSPLAHISFLAASDMYNQSRQLDKQLDEEERKRLGKKRELIFVLFQLFIMLLVFVFVWVVLATELAITITVLFALISLFFLITGIKYQGHYKHTD